MQMEQGRLIEQTELTPDYRVLKIEAPGVAAGARPGQFVHVRVPYLDGSVLRRPFSLMGCDEGRLAILYKCIGRGTAALARLPAGERVSLIGPLGNGFPDPDTSHEPVLVAGGYGVAPLLFFAARSPARGALFVGGRTAADILCRADYERLGWDVHIATEDGSLGLRGMVTDALDAWLAARVGGGRPPAFYACGPDGMLRAVGERAGRLGAPGWLSMDKRMGCGVGACLACVQAVRTADGATAWKRVCRDGPVFEAGELIWNTDTEGAG